jgi:hypothetical protein
VTEESTDKLDKEEADEAEEEAQTWSRCPSCIKFWRTCSFKRFVMISLERIVLFMKPGARCVIWLLGTNKVHTMWNTKFVLSRPDNLFLFTLILLCNPRGNKESCAIKKSKIYYALEVQVGGQYGIIVNHLLPSQLPERELNDFMAGVEALLWDRDRLFIRSFTWRRHVDLVNCDAKQWI